MQLVKGHEFLSHSQLVGAWQYMVSSRQSLRTMQINLMTNFGQKMKRISQVKKILSPRCQLDARRWGSIALLIPPSFPILPFSLPKLPIYIFFSTYYKQKVYFWRVTTTRKLLTQHFSHIEYPHFNTPAPTVLWTSWSVHIPVVSITIWSNLYCFLLANSNSIFTRSPRTVQHRQPLLTMTMSSLTEEWLATNDPSISTSPNCIYNNTETSLQIRNPRQ